MIKKCHKAISLALLCALLLAIAGILTACRRLVPRNSEADAPPFSGTGAPTETSISTEPSVSVAPSDTLSETATEPWMEAYIELLLEAPNWPAEKGYFGLFSLVDINFDGIPELFFAEGYRVPFMGRGFSYSDNQITEMTFSEAIPPCLKLYQDTYSNEKTWLAGRTEYSSATKPFGDSGYEKFHEWWSVDFSDLSMIQRDLYLAWSVRKVWYESDAGVYIAKGFRFWLYEDEETLDAWDDDIGDRDSRYEVTLTELERKQSDYFDRLKPISEALFRNMYDFYNSNSEYSRETLNRTVLLQCFNDWENRKTISGISVWDGHGAEDGWDDDIKHINLWQ